MDKIIEAPANGTAPPALKPDEVMSRIGELVAGLGYDGLAVVAVSPKFGNSVNPLEFMPDGWRLVIVPVKNERPNSQG